MKIIFPEGSILASSDVAKTTCIGHNSKITQSLDFITRVV